MGPDAFVQVGDCVQNVTRGYLGISENREKQKAPTRFASRQGLRLSAANSLTFSTPLVRLEDRMRLTRTRQALRAKPGPVRNQ
jgi:hypothetical protein